MNTIHPISLRSLLLNLALPLAMATTALADGPGDLLIGSTSDGGGNLLVDYSFDERPIVPVSASGFPGLYTSTDPGFRPAADEIDEGVWALDVPTTIGMEITAIDSNVQVQLGVNVLGGVGDNATIAAHDNIDPELSSLHTHPQFLLSLLGTGPGGFAEGEFSFRVFDVNGGYGDSGIHELKLSNGYLPPIESPTRETLACRAAVAKAMRKVSAEVAKRVGACLDKALVAVAGGSPQEGAKACNLNQVVAGSLASRLWAAHAKGLTTAAKTCGELSDTSAPFTGSAVSSHLGMAMCRAQEVSAATYGEGRDALEPVLAAAGGDGTCASSLCTSGVLTGNGCSGDEDCTVEHAIESALPCVKAAAIPEED